MSEYDPNNILHSVTVIPFVGYEEYVCYCGADAFSDGFRPVYQPKGTNLIFDCEPIDPPWLGLSACNKCNRLSRVEQEGSVLVRRDTDTEVWDISSKGR